MMNFDKYQVLGSILYVRFEVHIYNCFKHASCGLRFSFIVEDADNELANFKAWLDYVYHKTSNPKVCSPQY